MPVIYPIYSLNYRRPDAVPASPRASSSQGSISSDLSTSHTLKSMPSNPRGVPEALSFDRIITGGCCPPLTKREFLEYLQYSEKSAENLQFYLWYQDYVTRFSQMPESEKVLAPEWTEALADADRKEYQQQIQARQAKKNNVNSAVVSDEEGTAVAQELLKGSDFEESAPTLAIQDSKRDGSVEKGSTERPGSVLTGHQSTATHATNFSVKADSAFDSNGLNRPFTVQPYRGEISRILAIYIIKDAPRELNLSGRERRAVLKALEYTTHPSAFHEIVNNVEHTLRHQSHPNFVRHAICNGNRPRVLFARGLGIFCIFASIVVEILLVLSGVGRAWRVLPGILLLIGISTLIAAWKGMCIILHGLHHEHVRPWELFLESDEANEKGSRHSSDYKFSMESLMSTSSNSFEDEPWVEKYEKRNLIRKIFDREVLIQEPALKQIQDTIFVQSLLGAFVASAVVVAIFVAVPSAHVI